MNARSKALIAGGAIGALVGLLAAWIYVRDLAEEGEQESQVPGIAPGEALKLGLTTLGLLRQIAGLRE
jgi:hypothetical protein